MAEASHRRRQAGDEHQHETQQHEQPKNDNPADAVQFVRFNMSHNRSPKQIPFCDPAKRLLTLHIFNYQPVWPLHLTGSQTGARINLTVIQPGSAPEGKAGNRMLNLNAGKTGLERSTQSMLQDKVTSR